VKIWKSFVLLDGELLIFELSCDRWGRGPETEQRWMFYWSTETRCLL